MKVAVPFKDPGRAPGLTLGMSVSGVSVQALAQRSIYIHANHMRRTAQVVLRGYLTSGGDVRGPGRGAEIVNQPSETDKEIRIPFWTSAKCVGIGVAVALGYVERDALIHALVKDAPAVVSTVATPGSGDLLDPGCEWYQARGHIPFVVDGFSFVGDQEGSSMWVHTGDLPPPEVDVEGPPTAYPRTLYAPANAEIEIEVAYDKCVVCTVFIVEYLAQEIDQ